MTSETKLKLAHTIIDWCKQHYVWEDCCIYFDGKAWATWDDWKDVKGIEIIEGVYEYADKNPKDYIEYANPDTITMSFEGGLYDILNANCYGWVKRYDEFEELFKPFGCYFELGYAWSFSVYEI